MKCYYCDKEACAKVGTAKSNLLAIFFGWITGASTWDKTEIYTCRKHLHAGKDYKP